MMTIRPASAGYWARHKRVRKARGPAKGYPCADCGGPAHDWSLRHGLDGMDPADYAPRCRSCHIVYDGYKAGEAHHNAKLTWAQVREIRAARGTASNRALAARYGVAPGTISRVLTGDAWREP